MMDINKKALLKAILVTLAVSAWVTLLCIAVETKNQALIWIAISPMIIGGVVAITYSLYLLFDD